MKKLYRIILLLITLVFLTTYSPSNLDSETEKKNVLFKIKKIEILNNFLIPKHEIDKKLSKIYNKNIFLVKRKDIEKPLEQTNFLDRIEVKIKYPDTVIVKIFETKPVAILYKNEKKYLIDSSSNLILYNENKNYDKLPTIFGEFSPDIFISFINQLKSNNFPNSQIKNIYYFKINRWDLELLDGKIIKFPHKNTEQAIKESIELLNREDFKKFNTIDLRIDGKIIVE